jgi:hypothetical protein
VVLQKVASYVAEPLLVTLKFYSAKLRRLRRGEPLLPIPSTDQHECACLFFLTSPTPAKSPQDCYQFHGNADITPRTI